MADGLDALERQLRVFHRELVSFHEAYEGGMTALRGHHEALDPLWRDRFRKEYDTRWKAFDDPVTRYATRDASRYELFLTKQIRLLQQYLHGR